MDENQDNQETEKQVTTTEPVPSEGIFETKTQPKANNRLKMILMLVAGLSLAGLASYLIFSRAVNVLDSDTEAVLSSISNLRDLESAEIELEAKISGTSPDQAESLSIDSRLVFNRGSFSFDLSFDLDGSPLIVSAVFANNQGFVNVDGLSLLLASELDTDSAEIIDAILMPYEGKWIGIDSSALEEFGIDPDQLATSDEQVSDNYDEILDLIIDSDALEVDLIESTKQLNGVGLTGYLVTADGEKTKQLLEDIINIAYTQDETADEIELDEILESLNEMFSGSPDSFPVMEVWTDGTYLRQVVVGDLDSQQYILLTIASINSDPEIVVPEAELDIEDVIGDILGLFLGLGAF